VLKHDEVNVLASNHSRRATNCRISEDGGALLRELYKENPSDSTRSWWTRCLKDSSENRQDCAKRDANPPIGVLQSRDAYGEIHVLEKILFADISLSTLALIRYPSTGPSLKPLSTDSPCKLAAIEPAPERLSKADQAIKE